MNGWKEGRMKEWMEVRMEGRMEGREKGEREKKKCRKNALVCQIARVRLTYPYMLTFTPVAKEALDKVVFICLVSPDTLM